MDGKNASHQWFLIQVSKESTPREVLEVFLVCVLTSSFVLLSLLSLETLRLGMNHNNIHPESCHGIEFSTLVNWLTCNPIRGVIFSLHLMAKIKLYI